MPAENLSPTNLFENPTPGSQYTPSKQEVRDVKMAAHGEKARDEMAARDEKVAEKDRVRQQKSGRVSSIDFEGIGEQNQARIDSAEAEQKSIRRNEHKLTGVKSVSVEGENHFVVTNGEVDQSNIEDRAGNAVPTLKPGEIRLNPYVKEITVRGFSIDEQQNLLKHTKELDNSTANVILNPKAAATMFIRTNQELSDADKINLAERAKRDAVANIDSGMENTANVPGRTQVNEAVGNLVRVINREDYSPDMTTDFLPKGYIAKVDKDKGIIEIVNEDLDQNPSGGRIMLKMNKTGDNSGMARDIAEAKIVAGKYVYDIDLDKPGQVGLIIGYVRPGLEQNPETPSESVAEDTVAEQPEIAAETQPGPETDERDAVINALREERDALQQRIQEMADKVTEGMGNLAQDLRVEKTVREGASAAASAVQTETQENTPFNDRDDLLGYIDKAIGAEGMDGRTIGTLKSIRQVVENGADNMDLQKVKNTIERTLNSKNIEVPENNTAVGGKQEVIDQAQAILSERDDLSQAQQGTLANIIRQYSNPKVIPLPEELRARRELLNSL